MKQAAIFLTLCVGLVFAGGCISLTSWNHNKRHLKQVWNELQDLHEDIDRVVFGLERDPAE
jgi:hypothetical protein